MNRMLKAKDIMTTHVVTVNVDDSIDQAVSLMVKHRISGLPVLDKDGRPAGIVSEFDLLELICEGESEQDKVRNYMSAPLFGVCEEDSWLTVADVFRAKHIRRLPVLRDGMLVGIVTRHDLMHAIRDARRQIRQELTQQARQTPEGCQTSARNAACRLPGIKPSGELTTELRRRRRWLRRRPTCAVRTTRPPRPPPRNRPASSAREVAGAAGSRGLAHLPTANRTRISCIAGLPLGELTAPLPRSGI